MHLIKNIFVGWAIHPNDANTISYIDGLWDNHTLPAEGEIITRPFLVDPITRQPIPVRVVEIQDHPEMSPHTLAVVVTRTIQN